MQPGQLLRVPPLTLALCGARPSLPLLPHVSQLVSAPPPNNKELKELKELQSVARSQRLRGACR